MGGHKDRRDRRQVPESGHDLIIRRNRKSRKRFVGCTGYPDCRVTYPLPQRGEIYPSVPGATPAALRDKGAWREASLGNMY